MTGDRDDSAGTNPLLARIDPPGEATLAMGASMGRVTCGTKAHVASASWSDPVPMIGILTDAM
jgi:hypothetical protein